MGMLDTVERKGLFRLTRLFALIVIIPLLVALGGALILFIQGGTQGQSRIDPQQLVASLKPPTEVTEPTTSPTSEATPEVALPPDVTIPFAVQKHLTSSKNREILAKDLRDIPTEFRQEYLDNLGEVILAAEKAPGVDPIRAANVYRQEKPRHIREAIEKRLEAKQNRLYVAGAALTTLGLIAVFSLILVLLAIERNTRPHPRLPIDPALGGHA